MSSSTTTSTNRSTKSDSQNPSRLSDIALRKKKNADAQAAFRTRRTDYMKTLEFSVSNLESVVLVLQDSCREATAEAQELQQENNRLRQALRSQETFWRSLWAKRGQNSETESEFPSYPSPPSATFNGTQYPDNSLAFDQYPTPPSVSFPPNQNQPYSSWTQTSSHSSNSPHFAESPTLTSPSDMQLIGSRYPDEQKIPMNNLEPVVPYTFPNSRSISPSSTPPSSTPLTSPFPFTFNDTQSAVQDRPDFDYRRPSTQSHGAEVISLHGGTADISAIASGSGNDGGVRYRLSSGSSRRLDVVSDRPNILPLLPLKVSGMAGSGNDSQHGSDGGDSSYSNPHRTRPRRITAPPSRSPSPGTAPLSGTLAVIKAQAFGALRRTRVRSKRPAEGPAKVSREVLESRGIVLPDSLSQPGPAKRRRMNDDSDDFDAPS